MAPPAVIIDLRKALSERFPARSAPAASVLTTGLRFLDRASGGGMPHHQSRRDSRQRPIKNRSREFLDAANFGKRKCDFPSAISYSTLASQTRAQRSEVRSPIGKLMFATIYLPNFYLQAAIRHHPKLRVQPVALIDASQKKVAIIELNDAAEKAGITKGMTPSQALARCLHVVIRTRERAQENVIGEILLQHAFMLSPFVEATASGVCTVQFTDSRDLTAKLSRVIAKLEKCEIHAQAGIASSPETSYLAAHLARPVLQIDQAKEFLAPLPIETLAIA